jgi:hypothetical protein
MPKVPSNNTSPADLHHQNKSQGMHCLVKKGIATQPAKRAANGLAEELERHVGDEVCIDELLVKFEVSVKISVMGCVSLT